MERSQRLCQKLPGLSDSETIPPEDAPLSLCIQKSSRILLLCHKVAVRPLKEIALLVGLWLTPHITRGNTLLRGSRHLEKPDLQQTSMVHLLCWYSYRRVYCKKLQADTFLRCKCDIRWEILFSTSMINQKYIFFSIPAADFLVIKLLTEP